jgi:hypothetical protein
MKKSLTAIIVMLLSLIGFNAIASACDLNTEQGASRSSDRTANDNHNGKNGHTREK